VEQSQAKRGPGVDIVGNDGQGSIDQRNTDQRNTDQRNTNQRSTDGRSVDGRVVGEKTSNENGQSSNGQRSQQQQSDRSMPAGWNTGAVELILVRHGESQGNVAASDAQAAGLDEIDVPARDADVELSDTGREQVQALGHALAATPEELRPDVVISSPYMRAYQTADIAVQTAEWPLTVRTDERLRDRELGILDKLTSIGVENRFPEEAERRRWLGKFYYRPPGGESWADVALRVRSVLDELNALGSGHRVMLVCHDAVVMLFRYVLEGMSERELLDLAASTSVLNASVTRYVRPEGSGPWTLESFNVAEHLERHGVQVTEHAGDASVHPK
jgi:broad specificity phosphatase PhoE